MLTRRQESAAPAHPDDDALQAATDSGSADPATQAHLASCADCARRVAALRQLRHLVQGAALHEEMPRRDLAGGALARLRARHRTGSQLNEVLAGLAAFLSGLAALFSAPDSPPSSPPAVMRGTPERPGHRPRPEGEEHHD